MPDNDSDSSGSQGESVEWSVAEQLPDGCTGWMGNGMDNGTDIEDDTNVSTGIEQEVKTMKPPIQQRPLTSNSIGEGSEVGKIVSLVGDDLEEFILQSTQTQTSTPPAQQVRPDTSTATTLSTLSSSRPSSAVAREAIEKRKQELLKQREFQKQQQSERMREEIELKMKKEEQDRDRERQQQQHLEQENEKRRAAERENKRAEERTRRELLKREEWKQHQNNSAVLSDSSSSLSSPEGSYGSCCLSDDSYSSLQEYEIRQLSQTEEADRLSVFELEKVDYTNLTSKLLSQLELFKQQQQQQERQQQEEQQERQQQEEHKQEQLSLGNILNNNCEPTTIDQGPDRGNQITENHTRRRSSNITLEKKRSKKSSFGSCSHPDDDQDIGQQVEGGHDKKKKKKKKKKKTQKSNPLSVVVLAITAAAAVGSLTHHKMLIDKVMNMSQEDRERLWNIASTEAISRETLHMDEALCRSSVYQEMVVAHFMNHKNSTSAMDEPVDVMFSTLSADANNTMMNLISESLVTKASSRRLTSLSISRSLETAFQITDHDHAISIIQLEEVRQRSSVVCEHESRLLNLALQKINLG